MSKSKKKKRYTQLKSIILQKLAKQTSRKPSQPTLLIRQKVVNLFYKATGQEIIHCSVIGFSLQWNWIFIAVKFQTHCSAIENGIEVKSGKTNPHHTFINSYSQEKQKDKWRILFMLNDAIYKT